VAVVEPVFPLGPGAINWPMGLEALQDIDKPAPKADFQGPILDKHAAKEDCLFLPNSKGGWALRRHK